MSIMEDGEAVYREALALSLCDEGLVRPEHLAHAVVAHILDHPLLAARSGVSPTEPRWGWDLGPDDPRGVRAEADEATARREVALFPRDRRLMRREVTAWREAEGSRQP